MTQTTCPSCNGRGIVANAKNGSPEKCPNCGGQGQVSLGLDDLPFWYVIAPAQLLANAVGVVATVQIDNDSDFEWRWIIANSTGAFSVTLLDKFTSRPLSTTSINSVNIVGTAQLPFLLPKPYLLRRTSVLQGTFNDLSAAPNTIQFAIVGYKISG